MATESNSGEYKKTIKKELISKIVDILSKLDLETIESLYKIIMKL